MSEFGVSGMLPLLLGRTGRYEAYLSFGGVLRTYLRGIDSHIEEYRQLAGFSIKYSPASDFDTGSGRYPRSCLISFGFVHLIWTFWHMFELRFCGSIYGTLVGRFGWWGLGRIVSFFEAIRAPNRFGAEGGFVRDLVGLFYARRVVL